MLYEELIAEVSDEGISDDIRKQRIKQLHEFIKAQSHLHDDHGSAIIGDRDTPPKYQD